MIRTLLITIAAIFYCAAQAQPSWTNKAAKSICTLKTFDDNGTLIASSNVFIVDANGNAVSTFSPFKGASRAVAIDTKGREIPVECIIGADDTYDVAKFRVTSKGVSPLSTSTDTSAVGSTAWIMPYATSKKPVCLKAKVVKVERIQNGNAYYTLSTPALSDVEGCPLLNDNGEVIGIMQRPYSDTDTINYAVGVSLATALKTTGLSINDATLRSTNIKKALPEELDQALLTLYIAGTALDSTAYATLLDDFIAQFPEAPDGYIAKAQWAAQAGRIDEADSYMGQAINKDDKKDDAHYKYARLILTTLATNTDAANQQWTFAKAIDEARAAYKINPVAIYRQAEAQALMGEKRYEEAYDIFADLTTSELRGPETFFAAAQCKELLGDTTATLALLDSAVATFSKPYLKAAAPYLLARAQTLLSLKEYRKAVLDFNEYENLLKTDVNANFYYIRAMAEIEGHIYHSAIADLTKATQMDPDNSLFLAEKASLEIRLSLFDEAEATAKRCIETDPELSDGYLFLGLAMCINGDKTDGMKQLQKAKELGNPQAQALIEKYAQ